MRRSVGWGLALFGASWWLLHRSPPFRMEIRRVSDADPEAVLNRVARVENEPELIPGVQAVHVEEREENRVQYRVIAGFLGVSTWARFIKTVDHAAGEARWETLEGAMGFRQSGVLTCRREEGRTIMRLRAETCFEHPVAGPFLKLGSLALLPIYEQWLKNLETAVALHGAGSVSSADPRFS